MVLVHYKKTDHNQFIVEVPGSIMIDELIPLLVESKAFAYCSEQHQNQDRFVLLCVGRFGHSWATASGRDTRVEFSRSD